MVNIYQNTRKIISGCSVVMSAVWARDAESYGIHLETYILVGSEVFMAVCVKGTYLLGCDTV
jgi:hypothetical protein